MDTNNTQWTPPSPLEGMPAPQEKNGAGPLIGAIIIILVLALGGFYFWKNSIEKESANTPIEQQAQTRELGTSDDTGAIEADLEASTFDALDTSLDAAASEL